MDSGQILVLVVAIICFLLITFRCCYRLFCNCTIHTSCHRKWHQDDVWMALALIPLVARSVCVAVVDHLTHRPHPSAADKSTALQLLFPARLSYALFEWLLKLCICTFYFRLKNGTRYMDIAPKVVFWFIIITYIVILLATMLECQPLHTAWEIKPGVHFHCQKALGNLLSMAISNIVTDIALILLPIPALYSMSLSRAKRIQLGLLFSSGALVIGVTIARLPLIFSHSVSQTTRSLWASIEILVSCIVANFIFYYVLIKDIRHGHGNAKALATAARVQSLTTSQLSGGTGGRGPSSISAGPEGDEKGDEKDEEEGRAGDEEEGGGCRHKLRAVFRTAQSR